MTKSCVKSIRGSKSQISQHQTVHRRYHGIGMSKGKDICGWGKFFASLGAKS